MSQSIKDNVGEARFEIEERGHTAYADYSLEQDNVLTIRYVFAPEALRGSGAAGRLMQGITEIAAARNLKILPICGYAAAWLRKHQEYKDLMA